MAETRISGGDVEGAFHSVFRMKSQTRTLTGTVVLTVDSPTLQFMDPGGAGRNVDLPAEENSEGLMFIIQNTADAAEILTIRNDAAATIVTPTQNEAALVYCAGGVWKGLVGATA